MPKIIRGKTSANVLISYEFPKTMCDTNSVGNKTSREEKTTLFFNDLYTEIAYAQNNMTIRSTPSGLLVYDAMVLSMLYHKLIPPAPVLYIFTEYLAERYARTIDAVFRASSLLPDLPKKQSAKTGIRNTDVSLLSDATNKTGTDSHVSPLSHIHTINKNKNAVGAS
jgi:hypothetical protein